VRDTNGEEPDEILVVTKITKTRFWLLQNFNVELKTKIEKLESNASSSTTDDSLVKKN
jgi:hypothetical protein